MKKADAGNPPSHERVLRALDFLPPDRIPRYDGYWGVFSDRWREFRGLPSDADIRSDCGIDAEVCVADETPWPGGIATLETTPSGQIVRDGWGRVYRARTGAYFFEELDIVLKRKADLDGLTFEDPRDPARYAGFLRAVENARTKRCVFCKTGGPYLRTAYVRGQVQFLMDLVEDPPFAQALIDRVTDHITAVGVESLRRADLAETGIWVYDDIAGNKGPFISPATYERTFLPALRRMVAAYRAAGAQKVIYHSDGDIRPLLGMFVDAGIDGITPVEPKAGMDAAALRHRYAGRLAMVGGMCNSHVLTRGSRPEIEASARRILEAGREGGIVIGSDPVGPDVPVESYAFYLKVLEKYG